MKFKAFKKKSCSTFSKVNYLQNCIGYYTFCYYHSQLYGLNQATICRARLSPNQRKIHIIQYNTDKTDIRNKIRLYQLQRTLYSEVLVSLLLTLNIQTVADYKYCFTGVIIKQPGSVHDAQIFSTSTFSNDIRNGSIIPRCEKVIVEGEPEVPICPLLLKRGTRSNEK